jgi:periplasmic copper chaperone A
MFLVRRAFAAAAVAVIATLCPPVQAQQVPKVEAAWARPTVAGQPGGGGYLTIVGGSSPDRLVGASADVAASAQLHTMTMDGNVMHMREIAAIDIPAEKTVQLAPGGYHVMFMGLKRPLKVGDHFPLTLRFEKAGDVKVEMQVMTKPMGGDGAMHTN